MKLNLILLGLGLVQGQNDTSGSEVDDLGNKKNKKNKTKNKARKSDLYFSSEVLQSR